MLSNLIKVWDYMKDIISKRLDELVDSVLDMDYTKNKRVQSREMGIPYPTFIKYYNGTSECSATNLIKIANYYGVSTDYLLGRTDAKTPDTSISGCTQLTGLSETSIRKLMELNEENRATWYGDVCNSIISNDNFTALVFYLTTLVTRRFSNKKLSEFNYGATVQEVYEGIVSNVFFRLTTDLKEEYKSKLETDCRDAYDLVYGLYRGNKITEEQRDDLIKEFDKGNFDYVPPELRKRKGEKNNG